MLVIYTFVKYQNKCRLCWGLNSQRLDWQPALLLTGLPGLGIYVILWQTAIYKCIITEKNSNKRDIMALDRSPESCNVILMQNTSRQLF